MSTKNDEKIQPAAGTPSPAAAAPSAPAAQVVEAAPAHQGAEDKSVAAFIRLRKEKQADRQQIAADKQRIVALEAQISAPPAAAPAPAPVAATATPAAQPTPAVKAEPVVDQYEVAVKAIAQDPDVAAVAGSIIDLMDMVETDPKLQQLNQIDSGLAFREAKAMWKAKLGIAPAPITAVPVVQSGGMANGKPDLAALFAAVDAAKPGTKAFREAVNKVNEAMAKGT